MTTGKISDATNSAAGADPSVHPAGETKPGDVVTEIATAAVADEYVAVTQGDSVPLPSNALPDARLFAYTTPTENTNPWLYTDQKINQLVDAAGSLAPIVVRMLAPIIYTRDALCLEWLQAEHRWTLLTHLDPGTNPDINMAHALARVNADLKIMEKGEGLVNKVVIRFREDLNNILGRLDLEMNAVNLVMSRLFVMGTARAFTYLNRVDFKRPENYSWLINFGLFWHDGNQVNEVLDYVKRKVDLNQPQVPAVFLKAIHRASLQPISAARLLPRLQPFVDGLLKTKPDSAKPVLELVKLALQAPHRNSELEQSIIAILGSICLKNPSLFGEVIQTIPIDNESRASFGSFFVLENLAKRMHPDDFADMLLGILKNPGSEMEDVTASLVWHLANTLDKNSTNDKLHKQVIELLKTTKSESIFDDLLGRLFELHNHNLSERIKRSLLALVANSHGDDPESNKKAYAILCYLTGQIVSDEAVSFAWLAYLHRNPTKYDEADIYALLALVESTYVQHPDKVDIIERCFELFLDKNLPALLAVIRKGAPVLRKILVAYFDRNCFRRSSKDRIKTMANFFAADFNPDEDPVREYFLSELSAGKATDEILQALNKNSSHPKIADAWKLHLLKISSRHTWPTQAEQLLTTGEVNTSLVTSLGALFAEFGFHDMPQILADQLKTFSIGKVVPKGFFLRDLIAAGALHHPSPEMRQSLNDILTVQIQWETTNAQISAGAEEIAPSAEIIESPETGGGGGSGNLSITDGFDIVPALGVGTFVGLPVTSVFAQPTVF